MCCDGDMRRGQSLVWAINEGRGAAMLVLIILMGQTALALQSQVRALESSSLAFAVSSAFEAPILFDSPSCLITINHREATFHLPHAHCGVWRN